MCKLLVNELKGQSYHVKTLM